MCKHLLIKTISIHTPMQGVTLKEASGMMVL